MQRRHEPKIMYVLQDNDDVVYGVYDSLSTLRMGVDHCMRDNQGSKTLAWTSWEVNYPFEPDGWEWAYIAPDSDPEKLAVGGGSVPMKKYWDTNLVNIKWEPMPEYNV